jgi:hypothetical protein
MFFQEETVSEAFILAYVHDPAGGYQYAAAELAELLAVERQFFEVKINGGYKKPHLVFLDYRKELLDVAGVGYLPNNEFAVAKLQSGTQLCGVRTNHLGV